LLFIVVHQIQDPVKRDFIQWNNSQALVQASERHAHVLIRNKNLLRID